MNRNIIHTLWMAAALPLLLASCQQEELPGMSGASDATPLTITVTDGGYASTDKASTRAAENGYSTEFTVGDACGLYIVRGSTVVYDNVKLTVTAGADGSLTWQPDTTLSGGWANEKYFLYYPYQSDMSGKTNASATDADGFFAPLVSSWQPAADQSTYADYTASDLMTAQGTASKDGKQLSLSFAMTHRMAMAVIEMPKTVYKFTDNADGAIPDYIVTSSVDFTGSDVQPYGIAPGTYRCIVNPASTTATCIIGSYADGKREFTFTTNGITGSCYKTYRIDGAPQIEKQTPLQMGDYFCKDSDNKWYIIPQEATPDGNVIGIVFYVGQNDNDNSDYSDTGIGQQKCHGYAVALKDDTDNGYCKWGVYGTELGCCPTDDGGNKLDSYDNPDIDWSGYAWTQRIITAAGGKEMLNATEEAGYPATWYAVVSYETGCNAPSNSSGWFLPSIGQMWKIYENHSTLFASKSVATDLESDSCYWSSSESCYYSATNALYLDVYVTRGWVEGDHKYYNDYFVRPVLAF